VPDGSVVHFSMTLTGEGGNILQQADSNTTDGVARVSFGLDKPGLLQIRATSDPAAISEVLQLDVSSAGQPAAVTVIVPALTPQAVLQTPASAQPASEHGSASIPLFSAWLLTVLLLGLGAGLAYWLGDRLESRRWALRWSLCTLLGGLLTYNYLALNLPGGAAFIAANGLTGILGISLIGLLLGWAAGWLWSQGVRL
jgi:beta-N-acetylhexosaminidase